MNAGQLPPNMGQAPSPAASFAPAPAPLTTTNPSTTVDTQHDTVASPTLTTTAGKIAGTAQITPQEVPAKKEHVVSQGGKSLAATFFGNCWKGIKGAGKGFVNFFARILPSNGRRRPEVPPQIATGTESHQAKAASATSEASGHSPEMRAALGNFLNTWINALKDGLTRAAAEDAAGPYDMSENAQGEKFARATGGETVNAFNSEITQSVKNNSVGRISDLAAGHPVKVEAETGEEREYRPSPNEMLAIAKSATTSHRMEVISATDSVRVAAAFKSYGDGVQANRAIGMQGDVGAKSLQYQHYNESVSALVSENPGPKIALMQELVGKMSPENLVRLEAAALAAKLTSDVNKLNGEKPADLFERSNLAVMFSPLVFGDTGQIIVEARKVEASKPPDQQDKNVAKTIAYALGGAMLFLMDNWEAIKPK